LIDLIFLSLCLRKFAVQVSLAVLWPSSIRGLTAVWTTFWGEEGEGNFITVVVFWWKVASLFQSKQAAAYRVRRRGPHSLSLGAVKKDSYSDCSGRLQFARAETNEWGYV